MIPMLLAPLAGAGLTAAGMTPLMAGMTLGLAGTALSGGDIRQGIAAGLGGFGGAGIGSALAGAGAGATGAGAAGAGAAGAGAPLSLSAKQFAAADAANLAGQGLGQGQIANTMAIGGTKAPIGTVLAEGFGDMGKGISALTKPGAFAEGGVGQTFLQKAKLPGMALMGGTMMGSSLGAENQAMSDLEEMQEEQRERARQTQAFMSRTALPQYRVGPTFNLAMGGMVPDSNKTLIGYSASGEPVYADSSMTIKPMTSAARTLYADDSGVVAPAFQRGRRPVSSSTSDSGVSMEQLSAQRVGRSPEYRAFLNELQQGAGNRLAMQRSGYTGGRYMSEIPEAEKMAAGGYLDGGRVPGDGMSDSQPAMIDGQQPAALSSGEFVVPADVVSHLGNGSSDSGAQQLYSMMDRIRRARTGTENQAPRVNPQGMMPA